MKRHLGNCEPNVKKDAKFRVRHGSDGQWQIEIVYYIGPREYYRPATRRHPKLIDIVNDSKEVNGGSFYIDEFCHVLIRGDDGLVYCAENTYEGLLEFDVDGVTVSAEPPKSLRPGDPWLGPHSGRRYRLKADSSDIYYKAKTGGSERDVHLSDFVGTDAAAALARRLGKVKGQQGGRIYINERRHFFAPVEGEFLYLGPLEPDSWFPEPEC